MTQPRRGIGTTIVVVAVIIVLVVATMAFVALSLQTSTPPHGTSSNTSSASTNSIATPQCSAPCAVWTKSGGSNPEYVAISPDDSFVVVGAAIDNGSEIYALDDHGNTLWSHDLNHQVASIAISSNGMYVAAGGWQTEPGPAGTYDNGEVYLFSSGGKLLWSVNAGSSNPVFKVAISADGSKLAVDGEESIMYLSGADGSTIWSYHTGGNIAGMGMSADGSLVVASMGPIVAFNGEGAMLWSHPAQDLAVSVNSVAISSDGSDVWVGSAVNGSNGTLYLFNRQGSLLWQHQIFSPALSIQTGANTTAFVSTNFGALLYGADGSLLKNVTSSAAAAITGGCNPLPSFWYWSTNEDPVAFLDSRGNIVSSYNPGGFTVNAALSSDGSYASVVSQNGSSKNFSLAFVYLGQRNQDCSSTSSASSSTDSALVAECPSTILGSSFGTVTAGTGSPALLCVRLYYYSAAPVTINLTGALSIQALQYVYNGNVGTPRSFSGASNFTVSVSQSQLTIGGPTDENEGTIVAYAVTAKAGASGTYQLGFLPSSSLNTWALGQEPEQCGYYGQLVAGNGQPSYVQPTGCITLSTTQLSTSSEAVGGTSYHMVAGVQFALVDGYIYFWMTGISSSSG